MVDENDTGTTSEVAATAAPVETPAKKQRAPRKPKAAAEAAAPASSAATVRSAKLPRKKRGANAEETPAVGEAPVAAKVGRKIGTRGPGKAKLASSDKVPTAAAVTAGDEMGDLLQLEEENKQLRKTLAEKLRTENADLRKRLGV
jgi:hypothetical protein